MTRSKYPFEASRMVGASLLRLGCETIANNSERPVELSPPVLSHSLQSDNHGLEIAAIDVAPNGASLLALRHQIVQRMTESAVAVGQFGVDVDAAGREVGGETLIEGTLLNDPLHELVQSIRRIILDKLTGPHNESIDTLSHNREDKRLFRREMPVNRSHANSGPLRNLVHRHFWPLGGEDVMRDLQNTFAVTDGIGAGLLHHDGTSRKRSHGSV